MTTSPLRGGCHADRVTTSPIGGGVLNGATAGLLRGDTATARCFAGRRCAASIQTLSLAALPRLPQETFRVPASREGGSTETHRVPLARQPISRLLLKDSFTLPQLHCTGQGHKCKHAHRLQPDNAQETNNHGEQERLCPSVLDPQAQRIRRSA